MKNRMYSRDGLEFPRSIGSCGWIVCLLGLLGCVPQPENAVVIYSAADREYAQPILDAFERHSPGIDVVHQFDVEATKTVGLAKRIASESAKPQCDVFWNNELMHTLNLERQGLLQKITWDIPSDWPSDMRSQQGTWVGIAARARVLIVNRQLLPEGSPRPASVLDLANPDWAGKCGVALPLFGTTATHFTILMNQLGEEKARELFKKISENAVILSGNKQVALQVASGRLAWGLTDTDDALVEIDAGMPVDILFPDQQPHEMGTLRIPNAVAVIANSPHPVAAAQLANFLVSEDTEGRLAMGSSGQFPVRPGHSQASRAQVDASGKRLIIRWMDADFPAASRSWSAASQLFEEIFRK